MTQTLLVAVVLLLSTPVFAAETWVTIASDPPGASIYWIDRSETVLAFGEAPQRIQVRWRNKGPCTDTKALRVRWVSGAEASLPTLHVCKTTPGKTPVLFIRPSGIPGLEQDARYAHDLADRVEARVEAARLAKQQRRRDYWAGVAENLRNMPPPVFLPPPAVSCTSFVVGTTVFTNCQ